MRMRLKYFELAVKHDACHNTCRQIGDGHTYPNARRAPKVGKDKQAGNQEQQLPGEGQEDGFACHADALEEIGSHHLEADNREEHHHDAQSLGGQLQQSFMGGEDGNGKFRHQFADQESGNGHCGSPVDGKFQHPVYPVELLCAEVISGNGLHALVQSHHNHDEQEDDAVHNAECTDGEVAVIFFQPFIDKDNDETCRQVHQEWRHTDGKGVLYNLAAQFVDAPAKMNQFALIGKGLELPHQRNDLCKNGGNGCTLYSPSETVNKDRVEDGIDNHRGNGGYHRFLRMS